MSWGTELWDRYDAMCTYTSAGVDFLENSVAKFMKEKSVIETEYATKLRRLVKAFSPKDMPSDSGQASGNLKPPARSHSRAGTLRRGKNGGKDQDSSRSGPTSLGIVRKPGKDDEYGHMTAYKQVN